MSKGGDKQGKSEEKRTSGEAYNISKQTIYKYSAKNKKKSNQGCITPQSLHGGDCVDNNERTPASSP